jgi:hypothetical protein
MEANEGSRNGKKGLMNRMPFFVTNAQAMRLVQPTHQPLDRPTVLAQAAAVRCAALGQDWLDAALLETVSMRLRVIASVALHFALSWDDGLGTTALGRRPWDDGLGTTALGRRRGRPLLPCTGGMASTNGSNCLMSGPLAAVVL